MVDFSIDSEFQAKLDWMKDFVENKVRPLEYIYDYDFDAPFDVSNTALRKIIVRLQEEVKAQGLWAAHLPPHLGGSGFGAVKLTYMNEMLGLSAFGSVIFGCQGPDTGNSEILAMFGSDEQKEKYLKPLMDGEIFSTFAMTEPQGGSDPTNLQCVARRDGDDWIITGDKWFSSNARNASFIIVMAASDPDAPPYERATMFIVPRDAPGFEIVRDIGFWTDAPNAGGHPWIRFNDVRVPDSARLGPVGKGFEVAQSRLGGGRLHHAQRNIGLVKHLIDLMAERAVSRFSGGKPIAANQAVQHTIAQSYIEWTQYRLLVLYTAWMFDQQMEHGPEGRKMISAVKAAMAKIAEDVVVRAVHLHGSHGLSNIMRFGHYLAMALHEGAADGVTELHLGLVSKLVLRGYEPRLDSNLPSETIFLKKAWAQEKLRPLLDELDLTFEDGRASIETDIPVEKYNLKKGSVRL
jgi:acyl-CoA dehydrogenase